MKYHKHLILSCLESLQGIFFEDRYADKSIEYYLRNNRKWGSRDRRFFAETVYDCVRWWRLYWYLTDREPMAPDLHFIAASFWRRNMELPPFEEFQKIKIQKFEQRISDLNKRAIKESFPDWLDQELNNQLENWNELAPYFNQVNALVIRANLGKTSVDELIKQLASENIDAKKLAGTPSGLIIEKRVNIFQSKAFKGGLLEVQDGSSQSVAPFMDIEPGMRVVDACAGAGGKTLHIADLLQNKGKVVSLDIHQWKLDQLKLRARRNSYSNIEMKVIDGSKTIKRLKGTADRLLLDVPCTGLGVLRRNPDTKWKLSASRLQELQDIQKDILNNYCEMLKPGGKMLYATCSVLPSENENQVQAFLKQKTEFKLLKQKKFFGTRLGFDGFYVALLEKAL